MDSTFIRNLVAPVRPWRAFASRRNRPYQVIAGSQAVLAAFAADSLFVPFLLVLGAHPAVVTAIGLLPVLGSAAQAFLPEALRRTDGNLRGITVALTAATETRGAWFAAVAVGVALGVIPHGVAIALFALIVLVASSGALVAEATLFSWLAIILPEAERRAVTPKMMALTAGLSAMLLVPSGVVLAAVEPAIAAWLFAALFSAGALASLPLIRTVVRLPRPGRVTVPRAEAAPAPTPALRSFLRASAWNSLGAGLTPYFSVFAVTVLGMSPGFAMVLSGVWAMVSLVASAVLGGTLAQLSSARVLRLSYAARTVGMLLCVAAVPGSVTAGPILVLAVSINAAGFSATALGQTERLFRLTSGPALVAAQASFTSRNAVAFSAGGVALSTATVVAAGVGFPAWVAMFVAAALPRLMAARGTEVPAGWRTATLPTAAVTTTAG